MKPPFDKWDLLEPERILADAMERHRNRALAEARALDAATVGTNIVPPVDRHGRPWHQTYADAFGTWEAFVAAVRSDGDPGAVEFALRLLSRVAPEEVLPLARKILAVSPWKEMGGAVGEALGRVDDPAAVELALAHADVPYAKGGVSSSICARAWPIVLKRLEASRVMDTSRKHPRGETYFVESLVAYFGNHRVAEAWPVLARLYAESVDEYVLLASGHALIAWGDERSLALLRKDLGSRSERRRFFAVRALLQQGESQAMDALGGLEALSRAPGRSLAHELMSQVWQRARDAKKATAGRGGIADERYLALALAWVKDKRMLGICRYVLDCWDKAQVTAAKKRLVQSGKVARPAPAPKLGKADVEAVRRSMKKARKNLERLVRELGKLGYVFNFITYGGHQIDGLAGEEFSAALREDGMLALARLQRKFRLLESPYRTPQTLVGGPRADAALTALSGRTSTTKAMGKGSTQFQHQVQTEVPPKLLEEWLDLWRQRHGITGKLRVSLKPHSAGSQLLELAVLTADGKKAANVIFDTILDRRGRSILSVRDQNTVDVGLRRKRLMTLLQLFLVYRYRIDSVHYLTPTEDNHRQTEGMKRRGIFSAVNDEVGEIIVADVSKERLAQLLEPDRVALTALIAEG